MRTAVEMAAECRAKVVRIAGRVGDEIVAPIIENAPVRIREAVRHVPLEFRRARLETVDRAVHIAHGSVERLDIRAMENAVAEIHSATRLVADRVCLVM